jgi:hypothetical protein
MFSNMKTILLACLFLIPVGLQAQTSSQIIPIVKDVFRTKDLIQPITVQFQGNIVLSRYHRHVIAWEKGRPDSLLRIARFSSAQGGSMLWYEARLPLGMTEPQVSSQPFFIDSYQNRNYAYYFNEGPLTNGLVIQAHCIFQAWASDARPVGNLPIRTYRPTGPWDAILAYRATSKIQSNTPPAENGEQVTGPTQDEYRRVSFSPAGASFFKLPGQNRHFGVVMQLLKYDPLAIPNPAAFGWTSGVDQHVTTVPDPSLNEDPLPNVPKATFQTATGGEAEL